MGRLRRIETEVSEIGLAVNAKEDGTIVLQQGTNVIEWPPGPGRAQMVVDAIVTVSNSLEKDLLLVERLQAASKAEA